MINVSITPLPAAPLHAFEIWSDPTSVAKRFKAAMGFALPAMGCSAGRDALQMIRYEANVWLVEGDASALPVILADDGALTAIGGGIVRVAIAGPGWRRLLMEGGVFDAESAAFAVGSSAATIIDAINLRLHVTDDQSCTAYVPASYAQGLIHFWRQAAEGPE